MCISLDLKVELIKKKVCNRFLHLRYGRHGDMEDLHDSLQGNIAENGRDSCKHFSLLSGASCGLKEFCWFAVEMNCGPGVFKEGFDDLNMTVTCQIHRQ